MKKLTIVFLLLLIPSSTLCLGPKIYKHNAVWDPNTEANLGGYYLYWKPSGGAFADANRVVVPKSTAPTFDLNNLNLASGPYVIAVSAYNTEGNESGLSNEVTWDATYPGNPKGLKVNP